MKALVTAIDADLDPRGEDSMLSRRMALPRKMCCHWKDSIYTSLSIGTGHSDNWVIVMRPVRVAATRRDGPIEPDDELADA